MGLLTKLKSLLGFEDDRSQVRRSESGVTIEREPDEAAEPDAETESAVKGVDTDAEESFEAETESETSEPTTEDETGEAEESVEDETDAETGTEDLTTAPEAESVESQEDEPAEPAEPSVDAAEPEQTASDEPEPTPEETEDEGAETTDEPIGEGEDLEEVKGIGPAYAERLRDAGVANVAELATADADRLADETDLSAKRVSTWIERAQAR